MPSLYLDTNAIIQFVKQADVALFELFHRWLAGGRHLVTSELSLAEVRVRPLREAATGEILSYEEFLTSGDIVRTVPVDRAILRRSAELRAEMGGKLPDTIHVATALSQNCRLILSADKRLRVPDTLTRVFVVGDGLQSWENGL